jgi:hypothetical protein
MPAMRARILGSFILGLVAAACGPSMEADHVKTPDELIAEEEAKGAEQMKNQRDSGDYDTDSSAGQTDEDKRRGWDAKQSDIEMHRAANSAESCPESVTEKAPKGMANITVTFGNDGRVKSATINEPYGEDTAVGKCVLRAMKAVIVPPYQGGEQTLNWEIDLKGGKVKKSGPVGGEAAEGEEKKSEK